MRAALILVLAAAGCVPATPASGPTTQPGEVAPGILLCGTLQSPRLTESSGVVRSRRHAGVFWTHNDGGGGKRQVLSAFTRDGVELAEVRVTGVRLDDWEDLADDDQGYLYLGDIGDNEQRRPELAVYRVAEPDPAAHPATVAPDRVWRLRLPGPPQNCEGMFVWRGHGYVVTKVTHRRPAVVYRFALAADAQPITLTPVVTLPVAAPVTGASISVDGATLAVVAKAGAWLFDIAGDVQSADRCPRRHAPFEHEHIEACCFVPEGLLATAESREIYLFTPRAFTR